MKCQANLSSGPNFKNSIIQNLSMVMAPKKKTQKMLKTQTPSKKKINKNKNKQIKQLTHNEIEICIQPSFPEQITLKGGKFENSLKTRM